MDDKWADYKNKHAASPEQQKAAYEKARQGAIGASVSGSDIAGKLKSAWLDMVGTKPKDPREEE